jgi:hypothetical protein
LLRITSADQDVKSFLVNLVNEVYVGHFLRRRRDQGEDGRQRPFSFSDVGKKGIFLSPFYLFLPSPSTEERRKGLWWTPVKDTRPIDYEV